MPVKSAVCLIVKNEGPYLMEWVAYHRVLGFDKIVIYDNKSTDGGTERLQAMASAGLIEYKYWDKGANESPQVSAYKDCLSWIKAEWLLFIDADEFLVLHKHRNVNALLAQFNNRPEVTTIGFNWRMFGDSGMASPDGRRIIDRFTQAAKHSNACNHHLKSFTRVSALGEIVNMHITQTTGQKVHPSGSVLNMSNWGISDQTEFDVAQVNHYYTKTYEEYKLKKARGYADVADTDALKYNAYHDRAFNANNLNDETDLAARAHLGAVEAEIGRMERAMVRSKTLWGRFLNKTRLPI